MHNVKQVLRLQTDDNQEYYFHEGCFILEMLNTAEDSAISIARARVLPGEQTKWHCLQNTVERYLLLSGEGRVEIGNQAPQTVQAGDIVIIPAKCRQRIENTGQTDLIFLAICTPRFELKNYQALG